MLRKPNASHWTRNSTFPRRRRSQDLRGPSKWRGRLSGTAIRWFITFSLTRSLGWSCTDLIERIEHPELVGYTSTHVLSEMAHRLMTLEACATFGWPYAGIAQRLRKHPSQVQTLTRFRQAIQEVPGYGIRVSTISPDLVDAAAALSQRRGHPQQRCHDPCRDAPAQPDESCQPRRRLRPRAGTDARTVPCDTSGNAANPSISSQITRRSAASPGCRCACAA